MLASLEVDHGRLVLANVLSARWFQRSQKARPPSCPKDGIPRK